MGFQYVIEFGYFLVNLSPVVLIIRPAKRTSKGTGKFLPPPHGKARAKAIDHEFNFSFQKRQLRDPVLATMFEFNHYDEMK